MAKKSITVTVYEVWRRFPGEGKDYLSCYSMTTDYYDKVGGYECVPTQRTFTVGQQVRVRAFGHWRDGQVVDVKRTRPVVRYVTNQATGRTVEKSTDPCLVLTGQDSDVETRWV